MALNTGIYRPGQPIGKEENKLKIVIFIILKKCKLLEFCLDGLFLPSRRGLES